ncbi:hypothetical protein CSB20_01825 [bacterium DOLZORAL124_64_63]|nr:MAG: hypothetical protein CSB20_01825 [bacterium DOLZORAL124_64_63]
MTSRLFGGFLVLMVVLALLAGPGCGRQDRYEITSPSPLVIDTDGPLRPVSVFRWPSFDYSDPLAVYRDGQWLLSDGNGMIFRLLEDGYAPLPAFSERAERIEFMMTGPDDALWVKPFYRRKIWRWDGLQWDSIVTPSGTEDCDGLFCDSWGRIYLWQRDHGVYVLQDDETWHLDLPAVAVDLVASARTAGGQLAFLGSRLELVRPGHEGWDIGEPRLEGPLVGFSRLAIDEQGRWAVCYKEDGNGRVMLDGGQGEETIPFVRAARCLFWWDGRLHGYNFYAHVIRCWDGNAWSVVQDLSAMAGIEGMPRILPRADGRLLLFSNGGSVFFDGTTCERISPDLGRQEGGTYFAGQPHMLTRQGYHLSFVDGVWQILGNPFVGTGDLAALNPCLHPAPGEGLFLMGRDSSFLWDPAGGYTLLPQSDDFYQAFPQADGSIVIRGRDRLWHYTAAGMTDLGPTPGSHGEVVGVALAADNRILVACREALVAMDNGDIAVIEHYIDGGVRGLMTWPQEGLFLYGGDRFVSVGADPYRDWTPVWGQDDEPSEVYLVSAVADAEGGVWALESMRGKVLRLAAGHWNLVDDTVWNNLGRQPFLGRSVEGTVFFYGDEGLGLFQEGRP